MKTTVVNCNTDRYDIYIGRPTKWGNKFIIGKDGTREQVIEKYRVWLAGQWDLLDALDELEGKVLGCHCKPLSCHGDIFVELINERKQI